MSSIELSYWEPLLATSSASSHEENASSLWEDPQTLLAALESAAQQPPPELLMALLPLLQAPAEDFLLSPCSARIGALGVQAGCLFVQHELLSPRARPCHR